MLENVSQLLVSEISHAAGIEEHAAKHLVDKAIAKA
jgi:RNA polymerase-interacting CarD/CdnL/TRCF family regulator